MACGDRHVDDKDTKIMATDSVVMVSEMLYGMEHIHVDCTHGCLWVTCFDGTCNLYKPAANNVFMVCALCR